MEKKFSVMLAASEAWPFVKTGGLADVLGALPRELAGLGAQVSVVIPYYREIAASPPPKYKISTLEVEMGRARRRATVYKSFVDDAYEVYLIRHDPSFARPWLYGPPGSDYPDNALRFALFSRTAASLAERMEEPVDAVHCHDWQTALVPLLLAGRLPTVFTVHNIGYQGIFPAEMLQEIGLSGNHYHAEGIEYYGKINYLKAGIIWSDDITTVSPTYSREIQTPRYGFGLDGLMRKYSFKLQGILNGADYSQWNPETDPLIAARFHPGDTGGKLLCKLALLNRFNFPADDSVPVIGMTSRLAHQKGIDLVLDALPDIMNMGARLIILGSGDGDYERRLTQAASRYPGLRTCIGFDEVLAHDIMAGSDLFLMPSLYEPCGLSQLYSLKYGTIPVVRATGGLADTVEPFRPETGEGTGFLFQEEEPRALAGAVREALAAWRRHDLREALIQNGMSRDFSWRRPASRYLELYRSLAAGKAASRKEGVP